MTGDDLDKEVAHYLEGQPRRTLIAWIAAIVGVLAAVGLGYAVYAVNTDNDSNTRKTSAEVAELRKDNRALARNYDKLYEKFQICKDEKRNAAGCQSPGVPPVEDVTSTPVPSTVIVQRLTDAEIDTAVRRFCATTGQCVGKDGKTGAKGKDAQVSADMVSAAVTAYCDARGECRGADGTSSGEPVPPTDEQVLAAVNTYCADGRCKGDPGPLCPDGYHGEVVTVVTQLAPPEQDEIFACRRDTP